MKNIKQCFCRFSFYDQETIQATLEDMAGKGWMLQKTGKYMWTYKRAEPRKLRFSVTCFPRASDFDSGPTDDELARIEYCNQDGWVWVTNWGTMQIFYNENMDAVPIETEPVTQVENIRQSMVREVLFPQICMCAAFLLYLAVKIGQIKNRPVEELSDPFTFYIFFMFGALILAGLYEIVFYFYWSRKATRVAESDGVFLPIKGKPTISYILTAYAFLSLLLACNSLGGSLRLVLIWPCATLFIVMIGNIIKAYLKKRKVSRKLNRVVTMGSVLVLMVLCLGVLTASSIKGELGFESEKAVGTYESHGVTWEIYDDPLPLEIEELADVSARWSKKADHKETFMLSSTRYRQHAIPVGDNDAIDEWELRYTVSDVKWDFLCDFIKRAELDSRQDETEDGAVFTDHYEPMDASLWNADDAYQLHFSDSVLDTYLVFWGNRIVEITFSWEPTSEQRELVTEKLAGQSIAKRTVRDIKRQNP